MYILEILVVKIKISSNFFAVNITTTYLDIHYAVSPPLALHEAGLGTGTGTRFIQPQSPDQRLGALCLLVLVSQCINWHAATRIHIPR